MIRSVLFSCFVLLLTTSISAADKKNGAEKIPYYTVKLKRSIDLVDLGITIHVPQEHFQEALKHDYTISGHKVVFGWHAPFIGINTVLEVQFMLIDGENYELDQNKKTFAVQTVGYAQKALGSDKKTPKNKQAALKFIAENAPAKHKQRLQEFAGVPKD